MGLRDDAETLEVEVKESVTKPPARFNEATLLSAMEGAGKLVDDDELLRASVPILLRILGHQVETVDGGQSALDWLDGGQTPDLIILDMNMPEMSGLETLQHLRLRAQSLPVLLATGFLDEKVEATLAQDPNVSAIAKPFTLGEIKSKLEDVASRYLN